MDFRESLRKGELVPEMGVHMSMMVQDFLVEAGNVYPVAIPGLMEIWNRYDHQQLFVKDCTKQGWLVDDDMVINCMVPDIKRYFVGDLRTKKLGAAMFRMMFFKEFTGYEPRVPMTNPVEVEVFLTHYSTVFNTTVSSLIPPGSQPRGGTLRRSKLKRRNAASNLMDTT